MKGKETVAEEGLQTTSPHRELLKLLQAVSIIEFFGHLLNQAVFNPQSYTVNLTHN